MGRCLYVAKVLLLGLFVGQVLATIQVYLSNMALYDTLTIIGEAGYLVVPNERIMPRLQEFGPAFFGGLFFSLSVGAGLSLASFALAWIWDRAFRRNRLLLTFFCLLWAGLIVALNWRGMCLMASSYFLLIPPLAWFATIRWMPLPAKQRAWAKSLIHCIPIALLALVWSSQMDKGLFTGIRDNLLLSNPIGKRVNDFYYTYTLYPAEVFKSLDQRMLKACTHKSVEEGSVVSHLERALLKHDYLIVPKGKAISLEIIQEGNELLLRNQREVIVRATVGDFVSRTGAILKDFSARSDPYVLFRKLTFFSLLIGFPIVLYILVHAFFCIVFSPFFDSNTSLVAASLACLLVGVALLVQVHRGTGIRIETRALNAALKSDRWQERVAALKAIGDKGLEIARFPGYQEIRNSPRVPERYWLARSLGVSRKEETYRDLLAFLDDPHPNVVFMAFYALGQRGDRRAIAEIKQRIETSDDWYNQWYAYKALKALGWRQSRSK
ncbi:MAG: HEAT repeat domain-containing protein [Deltaproteobacteria bacterium]|nr:MAG: HEAT repeat domain-containing protein [Deltaproteobacteria bacterium]